MKKLLTVAVVALSVTACNSQQQSATTVSSDTTVKVTDTIASVPAAPLYVPVEGDVMMKDGKVMVWRNNTWVVPEGDVTLTNGTVISKDGVVKKDGQTIVLEEGETVNNEGNFFDKAGHGISKAWDATKKGVSKAGEATGKALKETGQAIGKGAKKWEKRPKSW